MSREREVCFTITQLDKSRRRRVKVQPVWMNRRQMEGLMLVFYAKGSRSWGMDAKTHRELKAKGLVSKLHKGFRCYTAGLTEDGSLLAASIDEAAKKEAVKQCES
jgi:hypothetical protein